MTVIAIDAMGGDRAPGEIVAGALAAVEACDVDILLVGRPDAIAEHLPGGEAPPRVGVFAASEVVEMHEDPANAIRTRKDSSLVRCAEAVRDGRAAAMVSAGNTGATMAAALLRWHRIKGVHRPAIAVPVPVWGGGLQILVDAGATVDPEPEWLVEWAVLARAYARVRLGLDDPSIGLLSNGEEEGKGDALRKRAGELLAGLNGDGLNGDGLKGDGLNGDGLKGYIGNVEGRDLMSTRADVVVTDGFTGNVAVKTMEGSLMGFARMALGVINEPDAPWKDVAPALQERLIEMAMPLIPDTTGGGMLLGVNGVCIISHGSSSATAIVNATRVARDCVDAEVVTRLREAMANHAG